jgi:hypothetical protein
MQYKRKRGQHKKKEIVCQKKYSSVAISKRWAVGRTNSWWYDRFMKLFIRYEKKVIENYLGSVYILYHHL